MSRPFEHLAYLILATARKRYPFALLTGRGLVAYFETRAAALEFINLEVSA